MASRKSEIKNCFGNLNEMQAAKENQLVTGNMPTSAPSLPIVLSDLFFACFPCLQRTCRGQSWNLLESGREKRGALEKASSLLAGGNRWQSLELGE
jgi:hypothetical protein